MRRSARWSWWLWLLCVAACATPADDYYGLVEQPPVDRAVLVSGGAFLSSSAVENRTFAGDGVAAGSEVIPIAAVVDVLRRGAVFQRVALDDDVQHRRGLRDRLRAGRGDAEMLEFLRHARERGFDLLLVVEELQDGPIEKQGTNGRWPVTLATWLLLGIGAVIPDHTFESRATLRITLRDLQTGGMVHDPLLVAGPIDLNLIERTDFLGLLMSIVVPPFLVGDDPASVGKEVRDTTTRRLLLSLARDLKSESTRQRLRERTAARIELVDTPGGRKVSVDAAESLSIARLRGGEGADLAIGAGFEQELLSSMHRVGEAFHYEAMLPLGIEADVQVLVGTLRGGIASATFAVGNHR